MNNYAYFPLIHHGPHTEQEKEYGEHTNAQAASDLISLLTKLGGGGAYTDRQQGNLISLLLFFKNKETRLKRDRTNKKNKKWAKLKLKFF
jgi:hypothetical protein